MIFCEEPTCGYNCNVGEWMHSINCF